MGATAGIIGSFQALQTIKLILGMNVENNLIYFNGITNEMITMKFKKDDKCKLCSKKEIKI